MTFPPPESQTGGTMNIKYFSTLLPISFLVASSVVAEDVVYTDLYATKDFSTQEIWGQTTYFTSDASSERWVDAEGNFHKPSATSNLHITANTCKQTGIISAYANEVNVHDVNYNITLFDFPIEKPSSFGSFTLIEAANCKNLNILGNMNVSLDAASKNWGTSNLSININRDDTYHVYGDVNVVNKDIYEEGDLNSVGVNLIIASQYQLEKQSDGSYRTTGIHHNTSFKVDGNLNLIQTEYDKEGLNGDQIAVNNRAQTLKLSTGLTYFEVGGVLSFDTKYTKVYGDKSNKWDMKVRLGTKADSLAADQAFDSVIILGGLTGDTILTMTEDFEAENHKVDLTFTNKKGVDTTWEGTYSNATLNKLEITMSGDAEGKQTMLFDEKSTTATGFIIDSLSVNGGEFALQNLSELEVGKFALNGGKFIALGTAKIANAEFYNGTIHVDTDSMLGGNDQLSISGTLEKAGLDKVLFDFANFDATDFVDTGDSFSLLYAENRNNSFNDDANADFAATNLNGAEANFSWVDNYLMVDFKSAVPEPASIAGIAGILALAFATYRRRK